MFLPTNDQDLEIYKIRGYKPIFCSYEQYNDVKKAFDEMDKNKDGNLTYDELFKMLKISSPKTTDDEIHSNIKKMFKQFDTNKDGKISF